MKTNSKRITRATECLWMMFIAMAMLVGVRMGTDANSDYVGIGSDIMIKIRHSLFVDHSFTVIYSTSWENKHPTSIYAQCRRSIGLLDEPTSLTPLNLLNDLKWSSNPSCPRRRK